MYILSLHFYPKHGNVSFCIFLYTRWKYYLNCATNRTVQLYIALNKVVYIEQQETNALGDFLLGP